MALPTKQEILARIPARNHQIMEPRLYPLEYAEALILENPEVMPEALHQEVVSSMHSPFTETYVPVVLEWWAVTKEKQNLYEFAAVLADAYLDLKGIVRLQDIPPLSSRREWIDWIENQ